MVTKDKTIVWSKPVAGAHDRQPHIQLLNPTQPLANAAFVALTSAVLLLIGWLIEQGWLARIRPDAPGLREVMPTWGLVSLLAWMLTAMTIGLVLPAYAMLRWRDQAVYRRVLLPYSALLVSQVASEFIFNSLFTPRMTVITSIIYVSYRVWQLWCYRQYVAAYAQPTAPGYRLVRNLLALGLALWIPDLAFLYAVAITLFLGVW